MLDSKLTDKVLTMGPAPDMKGGIAQVLSTYFTDIFTSPKFIAETVNGNKLKRASASFTAIFKLIRTLKRDRDIKIVHLHTATKVSFPRSSLYARIAKRMGRKVVMHIHGCTFDQYFEQNKAAVQKTLKNCDTVVALSQSWQDFFEKKVGLENVVIMQNIVPMADECQAAPTSDGRTHLLFLGQLGERKGVYDLLNAIAAKRSSLQGRIVMHIGGNGDTKKLEDTIARLGIGDMVRFEGWVSGDRKKELLRQSTVYVLPSYAEGLPISILEAMAWGHAVVSTPVGGIPEVVDSANGILVEPGDVDALGNAICALVSDPAKTSAMGSESLKKVAPHFSHEVEKSLGRLYRKLLSE